MPTARADGARRDWVRTLSPSFRHRSLRGIPRAGTARQAGSANRFRHKLTAVARRHRGRLDSSPATIDNAGTSAPGGHAGRCTLPRRRSTRGTPWTAQQRRSTAGTPWTTQTRRPKSLRIPTLRGVRPGTPPGAWVLPEGRIGALFPRGSRGLPIVRPSGRAKKTGPAKGQKKATHRPAGEGRF